MKKALLTLALAIFSTVYISVAFAFAGGSGTPADPYQIATCKDLQNMSQNLTASYELINDVNCADTQNWNNGQGLIPIGNMTTPFSGNLNGNNYKVFNLYINMPASTTLGQGSIGLFGWTSGNITNIGLENISINITNPAQYGATGNGSLAGINMGVISNAYSTGNIQGGYVTGGLVGQNTSGGTISNSYSSVNVIVKADGLPNSRIAGGLVGINRAGKIINSYATGNVEGIPSSGLTLTLGGLVGVSNLSGTITGSFATGMVSAGSANSGYIGGLVGLSSENTPISNSYATGAVYGGSSIYMGGLVGLANGVTQVSNSYATGCVAAGQMGANIGGLIGQLHGQVVSSYYNLDTSCQNDIYKGTPENTDSMIQGPSYIGWDCTYIWTIQEGRDYPKLKWQTVAPLNLMVMPISSPQQINTPFQIRIFANDGKFNGTVYLSSERGTVSPESVTLDNTGQWIGYVTFDTVGERNQLVLNWEDSHGNPGAAYSNYFDEYAAGIMPTNAGLIGIVSDSNQNPIANATVSLYPDSPLVDPGSKVIQTVTTNTAGAYSFNNVAPGDYYIQVQQSSYLSDVAEVELISGKSINYDVTLISATITPGKVPIILIPGIMGSTIDKPFPAILLKAQKIYPRLYGVEPYVPIGGYTVQNNKVAYWTAWQGLYSNNIKYTDAPLYYLLDPYGQVGWSDLKSTLIKQGYVYGCNLFELPYDWTLPITTIRDKYLIPMIRAAKSIASLCSGTQQKQVDIIAHSMGGLVVRSYIQSDKYNNDVRKFAMAATPNKGSDNVYYIWEGGDPITADRLTGETGFFNPAKYFYTNSLAIAYKARNNGKKACAFKFGGLRDTPKECDEKKVYNFMQAQGKSAGQLMPMFPMALSNNGNNVVIAVGENMLLKALNDVACLNPSGCLDPSGQPYKFIPPALMYSADASEVQTEYFAGDNKNTIQTIPVQTQSPGNWQYQDGVPTAAGPSMNASGDGTVLKTSVNFNDLMPGIQLIESDIPNSGHAEVIENGMSNIVTFITGQTPIVIKAPQDEQPALAIETEGNVLPSLSSATLKYEDNDEQVLPDAANIFVNNPVADTYTVNLTALTAGDYELDIQYFDPVSNNFLSYVVLDDLPANGQNTYTFTLTGSGSATTLTPGRTLQAPQDPQMNNVGNNIALSWIDPTGDANQDVDHYEIYWRSDTEPFYQLLGQTTGVVKSYQTSQPWSDAPDNYYVVKAVLKNGQSTVMSNATFYLDPSSS